jgi:predicted nucleotidyltransferase
LLTIEKKHEKILEDYLKIKNSPWIHEKKLWKKVDTYKKTFSYIPGVLCICVWNSLAMNAAHKESDIDLFIITKKNRIWTTRILITLILTLTGQRKTAKKHAEMFCLSFFITENHLDLKDIAIKNDIYLRYWIQTLVPIINKNHTFELFLDKNSTFFSLNKETLYKSAVQKNTIKHKFSKKMWDICEKILQNIFLPRTKKSFQKLWKPFWVIISDDILKFHNKDKRKEMRDIIFS